jgi:hypothetical protein
MSEHLSSEEIATSKTEKTGQPSRGLVAGIIAGVLILAAILTAAVYGLMQNAETTAQIRDIFIIFLAFESLIIGAAMVILVVQLASLINLLQNEVRPILDAANETIHTLRGTTEFLSENMVEPVIKLNSYLASVQRALELLGLKKR